jgi:hypothetical protein
MRLAQRGRPVHEGGIVKHDELLTASITPKGAPLGEIRRSLPRLTLLDCHRLHRLTFYLALRSLVSPLEQPFPRELRTCSVYVSQSEQVVYWVP